MNGNSEKKKCFHHSHFDRVVSRGKPIGTDNIKRDYTLSKWDFKEALKKFNVDENQSEEYECVGSANVRLQFCSFCFDAEKTKERDVYYVNKHQVAAHRQNICHGCLGYRLRQFSESASKIL